mgnify:CR=1 FL=1
METGKQNVEMTLTKPRQRGGLGRDRLPLGLDGDLRRHDIPHVRRAKTGRDGGDRVVLLLELQSRQLSGGIERSFADE